MKRNQVSNHPEPFFNQRKAECKRTQQLPTLLRQQCWELFRTCWQWCAYGCNNSQQCWDLQCIVGRIQPISLCNSCVMSVRGPNNVGRAVQTDPTLLRHASAMTVQEYRYGSCWLNSLTGFKLCATTFNNMQQNVQTDATCNIQKCWELLANNVASVCTGLKTQSWCCGICCWLAFVLWCGYCSLSFQSFV